MGFTVGSGQRAPDHSRGLDAQVTELVPVGAGTGLNILQAFAMGERREIQFAGIHGWMPAVGGPKQKVGIGDDADSSR